MQIRKITKLILQVNGVYTRFAILNLLLQTLIKSLERGISNSMTISCLYGATKWQYQNQIAHGFFGRSGGVSMPPYDSLNCSFKTDDQKINVIKNLEIIRSKLHQSFSIMPQIVNTVRQVHGSDVLVLDENNCIDTAHYIAADGIVTKQKKIAIGVYTADCGPILFYDPQNQIIAAAHAGWRGALAGIIRKTLECMVSLGCTLKTTVATIGPCIEQVSYGVSTDFYHNFINQDRQNEKFFSTTTHGCSDSIQDCYFDLRSYCQSQLLQSGISKENIEHIRVDTYTNPDILFSCRYAKKFGNDKFGTQLSAIMLK